MGHGNLLGNRVTEKELKTVLFNQKKKACSITYPSKPLKRALMGVFV
jgi:hypothetical protein